MSADNAIFVVKTGKPAKATFGVFHGSASWFQELWLDVDSVREPELRWTEKPNADRLAELFAEGEQFSTEAEALACAARLTADIPYAEYGVQFVDVTGKHEAWDKDIAYRALKDAHLVELIEAVQQAVKEAKPDESFMFHNPGYGENALLACLPVLKSELYYFYDDSDSKLYEVTCEWVPADGEKPEAYRLMRRLSDENEG